VDKQRTWQRLASAFSLLGALVGAAFLFVILMGWDLPPYAAVVLLLLLAGSSFSRWRQWAAVTEVQDPLSERIERARRQMRQTAALAEEIQAELRSRLQKLEDLQVQHTQYEELAALHQKQAEAVSAMVREEMSTIARKSAWKNLWTQQVPVLLIGAVLGALLENLIP
jgi:hypothetical protein